MDEMKRRMLVGERYRGDDATLVAERLRCRRLLDTFNRAGADEDDVRAQALGEMLGAIGPGTHIMPHLACDYGMNVRIGAHCFLNYDAVLIDCAPIVIGDAVFIGPRVQLVTALHPMDDHAARRGGWETAVPVTIGDGVWLGAGVLVCPGVTIGDDAVVGAGSVVTRDVPARVFAAGNPCRVIRTLGNECLGQRFA